MSLVRYKHPNGTVYVYESTSHYDPATQQSRPKRKMIGKIDPITGAMIPTEKRGRPPKQEKVNESVRAVVSYGATYTLNGIAKKSGIMEDLKKVFPKQYKQLLSLAYYLTLEPNNALRKYAKWTERVEPFNEIDLSSQRISELFASIKEDHKQRFFQLQQKRFSNEDFWVFDTTSISTYGQNEYAAWGYNKEHDNLKQINLGLLVGERSRIPVMYRKIKGNIVDSKTLQILLAMLKDVPQETYKMCLDRGFYSQDVLKLFYKEHVQFVIGGKRRVKYIEDVIHNVVDTIGRPEHYNTTYKLGMMSQKVNEFKASETSHYPLTVHVYYDKVWQAEGEDSFLTTLDAVENTLKEKQELSKKYKSFLDYLTIDAETGAIERDYDAIEAHLKTKGIFVLLSNTALSSAEVLRLYRDKDIVEKKFKIYKEDLGMRRIRSHNTETIDGRLFVQYLSLLLEANVREKLRAHKIDKDYTLDDVLTELKRIFAYSDGEGCYHLAEVTEEQEKILKTLGVRVPVLV